MKVVITPKKYPFTLKIKELAGSGHLIKVLAYRDFKARYAQTFLGVTWVILQPLLTLLIFTLVFGIAVRVETKGVPYPVFMMTGMIAWSYIAYVIGQAGQSLINAQSLVTKVYFPRLVIPISKSIIGLIDLLVSMLFTIVLMLIYKVPLSANIYFLPILILATLLLSLSVGIYLSALTIRFRDLQYTIPFLLQLGIYLAPVAYPSNLIPESYQFFYYMNPAAGIIDGFRWCLLGAPVARPDLLILNGGIILALFLSSIVYFIRMEHSLADII